MRWSPRRGLFVWFGASVLTIEQNRSMVLVLLHTQWKHQAVRVVCSYRVYFANAFKMGSANSSVASKCCACASIAVLAGIISLSVSYTWRQDYLDGHTVGWRIHGRKCIHVENWSARVQLLFFRFCASLITKGGSLSGSTEFCSCFSAVNTADGVSRNLCAWGVTFVYEY
jgi:hypothetical protein